jgi:DNA-binding MarR family transcriptional regulator
MTEPRWLSGAEQRAWRGYRRMRLLLDAAIARDSGLSDSDYDVLSTLSEATGHRWRLNELAARLTWSKSRLSHHVSRMRQRGLVDREDCAEDARGAVVRLTPAGLAALRRAAPPHVDSVRRHLIDVLSPAQLRALSEIAELVVGHAGEGAGRDGVPTGDGRSSAPARADRSGGSAPGGDRRPGA